MSDTVTRRPFWRRRRRGDHVEDRTLTAATVPPVILSSTSGDVTPGNALAVADAYACVRALADAAASVPLIAYRRAGDSRRRAGGRTAELLDRPAPATTQANLIAQVVAHLNLWGNAYLGKYRDVDGRVAQIGLIPPDRVTPELRAGQPIYTVTDDLGRQAEHGTADVVHVRALSTDGLVGLSPVRQARSALGLSRSLTEHASRFFANDARPSGIVKVQGHGNTEAVEHLRAAWEHGHKGVSKAHRIAVVAGDIEFSPIGMPLDDAQFLEQRQLSATEVARIFRVPPWVVGAPDGGSLTYANVEQQASAFVTFSLRPWLVLIEQAISTDPDLCPGGLYVEFLLDALLRADHKTRADVYALALDPEKGWLTRAEVRRLENLEPEPETETS